MQQSLYLQIFRHLYAAWKKDHPNAGGEDPSFWGFRGAWVESAFADRVPPQYVDQIKVEGQPWIMVFAKNKLHLARLTNDHLEVIFAGALVGGRYQETIGDRLRIEFSHPRLEQLKTTIVVESSADGSRVETLRALLRDWAETTPHQ